MGFYTNLTHTISQVESSTIYKTTSYYTMTFLWCLFCFHFCIHIRYWIGQIYSKHFREVLMRIVWFDTMPGSCAQLYGLTPCKDLVLNFKILTNNKCSSEVTVRWQFFPSETLASTSNPSNSSCMLPLNTLAIVELWGKDNILLLPSGLWLHLPNLTAIWMKLRLSWFS